MKTTVALYNSHDDAVHALTLLKECHFPLDNVSIVGKTEIEDDQIKIKPNTPLIAAPLVAGTAIGTTLGILTGIGLLTIPGFGVLFGAGAIVGLFGGLEMGLIAGGIGTILVTLGVKEEYIVEYEQHVKSGKYLVVVQGSELEIETAKDILAHDLTEIHIH